MRARESGWAELRLLLQRLQSQHGKYILKEQQEDIELDGVRTDFGWDSCKMRLEWGVRGPCRPLEKYFGLHPGL